MRFYKKASREVKIFQGNALDVLATLPSKLVQSIVTSIPFYDIREYPGATCTWPDGWHGQLGREPTIEQYLKHIVQVFREAYRVLRDDGSLWIECGDKYCHKTKELLGVPWLVIFALRRDGWKLRAENIWEKPNARPETVYDRTSRSHTDVFHLSKKAQYFYDRDAVREKTGKEATWDEYQRALGTNPGADADRYGKGFRKHSKAITHPLGRMRRSVWKIPTQGFKGAHFAVFPEALVAICIAASSSAVACPICKTPWIICYESMKLKPSMWWGEDNKAYKQTCQCNVSREMTNQASIVLDLFSGTGRTGMVARKMGRHYIGIDISRKYVNLAWKEINNVQV